MTLGPRSYDKMGIVHCGVIREGRITVAGEIADIDDGEEKALYGGKIKVQRTGEEYTFTRAG